MDDKDFLENQISTLLTFPDVMNNQLIEQSEISQKRIREYPSKDDKTVTRRRQPASSTENHFAYVNLDAST